MHVIYVFLVLLTNLSTIAHLKIVCENEIWWHSFLTSVAMENASWR